MLESISQKMADVIREVETALIEGRYSEIGSESRPSRLSASEIEMSIREYRGRVTPAPESALMHTMTMRIRDTKIPTWSVDFDLWIDGKQSDLTLFLTIKNSEEGGFVGLVDNLHVL